jgi:hypothetical protein
VACGTLLLAGLASAQAPVPPCAECITLVVDPGQVLFVAGPLNGLRIAIRVPVDGLPTAVPAIEDVRRAGGEAALLVMGVPLTPLNRDVVRRASAIFVDITGAAGMPPAEAAFHLKIRFTELRGAFPGIQLGVVATNDQQAQLLQRDLGPYVDVLAERPPANVPRPTLPATGDAYAIVRSSDTAPSKARPPGGPVRWLWQVPADVADGAALVKDLARSMPFLVTDLLPGGAVDVFCDGRPASAYLNPKTLDTVAIARDCLNGSIEIRPDATAVERVSLSNGDVLLRVAAVEGQFAADVSVTGRRALTVEEIVARHQAVAARQRATVRTLISTGTMTLTFEAPGFSAPVAISSETVIYTGDGRTEIEQRSIRINGIEFAGGSVPRLPIIEPERVAAPPLEITLSSLYRYTLAGRERLGDAWCYVVAFEPADDSRALFRGRAWIAADTFAMRRVAAVQTGLRGPIVSSEQVDEFAPHPAGVWLLARSEVRQIYEGAAHRTPIHRVLAIASHDVNPPGFVSRRSAAYASSAVMLRETAEGFRYLRRDRGTDPSRPVEGVVAGPANRIRTVAVGLIVDPNISRPLPFAGLSYVDFNLLGTGTQVNAFFGGTYGQVALSVPSLGGTRWQMAGRAFGIASSYHDRAFHAGREVYEHNITQRPAHASVWALRPIGNRFSLRAGYELDYTQFGSSESTSRVFTVPADQVAHSLRVALEGQRFGWNGTIWWSGSRRAGWRPWGTSGAEFRVSHADYQRYGVTLARPFVFSPRLVARLEAAWVDGRDLDRFSRYAFGSFDNRLRGYPSALIRYDRGGAVRLAGGWAMSRRLRVDGFLDTAYVHDPGFGSGLRNFTGLGTAVEMPAPFGMLVAAEWGYGFQGVNAGGRRGTHVVRLSALKIF